MTTTYTRRDTLKLMGAAGLGGALGGRGDVEAATTARAEELRGIFVILSTPYTQAGALDYEDLAFQVEWLQHAGVHGLVWPQN